MIFGFGEIPEKEKYITTSFSRLQSLREDPEIYEKRYVLKEKEETESMDFGNLVDMALLEPHLFNEKYLILPAKTEQNDLGKVDLEKILVDLELKKTGNKADLILRIRDAMPDFPQQYDEIVAELTTQNKVMIPPATMARVIRIVQKVQNGPAAALLKTGVKQAPFYWQCPTTSLVLRGKPDDYNLINGRGIALDLKVTKDWNERRFNNTHYETGRHMQAAIYLDALSAITGTAFETFGWVAVEPSAPNRVRYYQADFGMLEAGRQERDYWLKDMAWRLEKNDWSPRAEDNKFKETSLQSWDWSKIPEVLDV